MWHGPRHPWLAFTPADRYGEATMGGSLNHDAFLLLIATLAAAAIGGYLLCIWVLWSAAVSVPQPYRMRWPLAIWLLAIPLLNNFLSFVVLIPLSLSYRRFLRNYATDAGDRCGFGLILSSCIFHFLNLLTLVPSPPLWLRSSLPWVVPMQAVASIAGQLMGFAGDITFLVVVMEMWSLRRHARGLDRFMSSGDADNTLSALQTYMRA